MSTTTDNETALIRAMRQRTIAMEREGNYWSDDERRQLKENFEQGMGITEIALNLQRTEVAVMQQILLMNLYEKRHRSRKRTTGCLCGKCTVKCDRCRKS